MSAVPVSHQVRVPPHDLDAETSVLGAILLDPTAITRVLDQLSPDDFYRENNGQIFRAAQNLFREGEPIDNVTLAAELAKLGVLDRVGGRAQLADLQESVPTAANVEHYARIVKDKAYKRKLISAGTHVTSLGYDEALDADEAVNAAQAHVYAISDDKVGTGLEHIYGLLKPAMDRIDAQMASGGGVIGIPSGFHDLDRMTNGFKAADLAIIAGRPSMGKCVRSDTLVVDPETGARLTIEEAVARRLSTVFGLDDAGRVRPTAVGAWVDSGVQPCYRVTTRTGRSIEVTHHHPFMTVRGWEPLHDVALGERIAIPRCVPSFGNDQSLELGLVRLLGYLIAEGGLTPPTPSFSNTDPWIVEDFKAIIGAHFPELHIRFNGRCTYIAALSRGGPLRNPLKTLLRDLGLWGHLADAKRFPAAAWTWTRSRLREFVRAVMSCDGTIYSMGGYPRIEFAVASEALASDMQHALARFGIVGKLWRKKARCWRVEVTEPRSVATYQREIGWVGEKAGRFPETPDRARRSNTGHLPREIWTIVRGAVEERATTMSELAVAVGEWPAGRRGYNPHVARGLPARRLAAYASALKSPALLRLASPDLYWDEVVGIEPVGEHHVYDLTVPDGANFIAADIVVHNTSFVLNVTLHAAVEQKKPVAIFSLEMSKEQLVERMLCEQARIDAQRLHRGTLSDVEYERLAGALGPLGDAPIFIDDSPTLDDLTLRLKSRQARSREGIELIVLDYLQLMHGRSRDGDANRVQEVSAISRALKGIARELSIPVIAISQLSRAPEARPDKRPILSDLRESGCLTGDTRIFLPDFGTYRQIADLVGATGFRVLALNTDTWELEPRRVTSSFSTGVKPVFRLTTRLGRTVRATGNHKFLAVDGWKRLDELALGDRVAVPRRLPGPREPSVSEAELALLGHLIGDGCTLPRHAIQYTAKDVAMAEHVAHLAEQTFREEIRPIVRLERSWYQVYLRSATHLTHGKRNPIAAWLDGLGVFGLRSHEKFVPDIVFRQPRTAVAGFLRHLWATDGCLHLDPGGRHYPAIYYATSSVRLARDVQSLLLRLEINAKVRRTAQTGKGRDQFHVRVSGRTEMERFLVEIGACGDDRTRALEAMLETLRVAKENTNRDVLPSTVWQLYVRPAMALAGMSDQALRASLEWAGRGGIAMLYRQNLSRERALRIAQAVGSSQLRDMAVGDVYWDEVISIEADGEEEVYDLTVDGLHNFTADNLVVHNSIEQDADIVMFLYRDDYYNREKSEKPGVAEVIVAKHRNGPTGMVELIFRKELTRFENMERRRPEVVGPE